MEITKYNDVRDWVEPVFEFLNRESNIHRMEGVIAVGRPPARAIEDPLLDEFPRILDLEPRVRIRVKQMIGALIRQILEQRGYRHDRYGLRCGGRLFTVASGYTR